MRLLNPIKTYKNFKKWKKIVVFNQSELEKRFFLTNWLYQLGLIVSLTSNDIEDLKYIYDPFQLDIAKRSFMELRLRDVLKKHNEFFLSQGLSELINDDFKLEESKTKKHTYYVTLSFRFAHFNNFVSLFFLISFILSILSIITYIIL